MGNPLKRKVYLCVLFLIVILFQAKAEATNICGPINSTTWTTASSPYVITCSSTVPSGATLIIQAGVTVKFNSSTHLIVQGAMNAIGTQSKNITFTSSLANPTRGSWRGIYFETTDGQLSYVKVMWGGNAGYSSDYDAAVVVNTGGGGPLIDHLTITESSNSGFKGYLNGVARTITNSTISNCTGKGAIVKEGTWNFTNTTISGNGSYGIYVDYYGITNLNTVTLTNNTDYAIGATGSARINSMVGITATGNGGGSKNAIGHLGGAIQFSGTIWPSGLNWVILAPITVSNGTLTINAGAVIKFASGAHLLVSGTLTAIGTSSQPITFTSSAATPTRGSWRGIYFETTGGQLSYVNISWGGNAGYSSDYDAAVVVNTGGGGPLIDHLTITESSNSGFKGYLNGVARTITDSTISNCTGKGAIVKEGTWNFTNTTISGNGSYGIYVDYYGITNLNTVTLTNNSDYAIGATGSARINSTSGITATGNGGGTKNAIGYLGGDIAYAGTIWTAGIDRIVLAPTTINYYAGTLTISPGATIKFASSAYLQANNTVTAVGNSSQPITFTSSATSPTRGSWRGIYFEGGSQASQLSYVNLSWGGSAIWGGYEGMIVINASPGPSMDHVTVTESSTGGIKMANGWPTTLSNSSITNCTGDGLTINGGGVAFTNTTISNNGGYGAYVDRYAMLNLYGGAITNNVNYAFAAIGDARIGVYTLPTITGNGSGNKNSIAHLGGFIDGIGSGTTVSWPSQIPVVVLENVTVTAPGILAIDAGSIIKFAATKRIEVSGKLTAIGTVQSPILFTSNLTTPTPGSWSGLVFNTGSNTSQVKYATVSYGGYPPYSDWDGAILLNGGSPNLDYVTITYSSTYAIRVNWVGTPTPTIKHCAFANNTSGGIKNDNAAIIDAKLNFWNSTNGPSGSGPGNGQSISTNVLFDPYYSAAPSNPHFITTASIINQTFNPGNGVNISIPFSSTLSGNWTALFKNAVGTTLRTYTGTGQTATVAWDGRDSSGTLMLDGTYNFEIQSTTTNNEVSSPVKGAAIIIDSTKLLAIQSFTVGTTYISPNNDGIQDTSAVQAVFNFEDVNWTLNFRNSANAIVRTTSGQGTSFTFVWDGKDSGSVIQADGIYSVELLIVDGSMNTGSTKSITLDNIFPVSQVTSPTGGGVISNVYQGGSAVVPVNGSSGDLNYKNWILDYGSGASPSTWIALNSGTSPLSSALIYSMNTQGLANGQYTVRLQTWDLAGNLTPYTVTFTVGNFTMSMNVREFNAGAGSTVTYTSAVPFTLTQTIQIKDASGNVVQTLQNGVSRNQGTYNDVWNGRNASNILLPDGVYYYVSTVTDGTNQMSWDLSNTPNCCTWYEDYSWMLPWNPFNNQPLTFTFTLPSPQKVAIVFSPTYYYQMFEPHGSMPSGCTPPNFCYLNWVYKPSGTHKITWAGVDDTGAFRPEMKAYKLEWDDSVELNIVMLFGTKPAITNDQVSVTPALFYPDKGPQNISFTFSSYQSQAVTATVKIQNQQSLSVLRTITQSVNPGTPNISWDGKADNGMWVAPGGYTVTVTLTDSIGNTVKSQILTTVRY